LFEFENIFDLNLNLWIQIKNLQQRNFQTISIFFQAAQTPFQPVSPSSPPRFSFSFLLIFFHVAPPRPNWPVAQPGITAHHPSTLLRMK
jgi:hypothetical protein